MTVCYNRTHSRHGRGKVNRSSRDKVFGGVCGGLGQHFDVSANWLRVGFVVGSIFTFPVPLVLYILCIFLMPRSGQASRRGAHVVPPPIPKFHSREEALGHLDGQFDLIESRIRELEDHVTSKEYVLKRKFEEL